MRQECIIYASSHNDSTPDEPFTSTRDDNHHYARHVDFVLEGLGRGPGKCLVIGSPLFEALELSERQWQVTYANVRKPANGAYPFSFVQGDASQMDFGRDIFDAASTTCVLCHAGMGRYGDPLVPDADELILMNIFRALKKRARVAVTFGPFVNTSMPIRFGNTHRLYNLQTAREMTLPFRILNERVLDIDKNEWVDELEPSLLFGKDYLSMLLEKP